MTIDRTAHASNAAFLTLALLSTFFGFASVPVSAQEVTFLAIRGDGTASVILDRSSYTAYIHDGGRVGVRGIAQATVNGEPLLGYLRTKGILNVVFSCSHPHADHMGAIEATVGGDEILRFKHVAFVDAILPGTVDASGKTVERLEETFKNAHGEVAKQKLLMELKPAINADRFAELKLGSSAVVVSNFEYDPKDIGGDIHDRSLIIETRVQVGNVGKTIVDFDDGSEKLIKHWASRSPPPDVVVMAHHGSRNNNMEPVLKTLKKGTSYVIFTANTRNQFFHPSPQALEAAIDAVGIDRVYVTGSQLGNNIVIKPDGVSRSKPVATSDAATLIRERIARADLIVDSPKGAKRTKSQAAADRRAMLSLAKKHHIHVVRTSTPDNSSPFSTTHGTAAKPGGSTSAPVADDQKPPPRTVSPTGMCICATIRNGVIVSKSPIPVGASCGGEICGSERRTLNSLFRP